MRQPISKTPLSTCVEGLQHNYRMGGEAGRWGKKCG